MNRFGERRESLWFASNGLSLSVGDRVRYAHQRRSWPLPVGTVVETGEHLLRIAWDDGSEGSMNAGFLVDRLPMDFGAGF